MGFGTIIQAATQLGGLDLNQGYGKYHDKYPALKKYNGDIETWWDGLTEYEKMDIGCLAVHCMKLSPNSRSFNMHSKYSELKRKQIKIIKFAIKMMNNDFSILYLQGMFENYLMKTYHS